MTAKKVAPRKGQKKSFLSGIIASAVAVLLTLYITGRLPQIDTFFAQTNTNLQSHNDEAVAFILQAAPVAVIVVLAGTISLFVYSRLNRRSRKTVA